MSFYVYILQSEVDGSYYKGISEDYYERVRQHNSELSHYASRKIPWHLIYLEIYESKREGLIRERILKKYSLFAAICSLNE
jgi:putative endonuclease